MPRSGGTGADPGVWGSILGLIAGSFFSPLGTIVGAFLGALAGEVIFHRDNAYPLRSAMAVSRGTMLGIVLKLAVTGVTALFYVRALFRLYS